MKLPVAVIGVGHLGKEHARILSHLPDVELIGVVDPDVAQAQSVAQRLGTRAFEDYRPLLGRVQAVVVAAPTAYHHAIACDLLRAAIPLLVEKPLANSRDQGAEMVALARRHNVLLQVGHIERYNPAYEELLRQHLIPRYIRCERLGGFTGRSGDVGAVLDLMIHDIDLILNLLGEPVHRVEAIGATVLGGHEDLAQARLSFPSGCVADLAVCRVSPEVRRSMHLIGVQGAATVDWASKSLCVYRPTHELHGVDSRRLSPERVADLKANLFGKYLATETIECSTHHAQDQLTRELREFVDCVRTGAHPRVDGVAGLAALEVASRVLDAIHVREVRRAA
ncbi:MAG: Gfo/Idh/MocA family oxidoreductase [Gemmataceae bacterium]